MGAPEVVLILLAALIIFGPRKLPELGKSFGQAMAQFRRASEDFKRTWEQEVEVEKVRKSDDTSGNTGYDYAPQGEDPYSNDSTTGSSTAQLPAASGDKPPDPPAASPETVTATAAEKKHWI